METNGALRIKLHNVKDVRESLSVCFPYIEEKISLIEDSQSQPTLQSKPKCVPDLEDNAEISKKLCPKCSSEMRIKIAKKGKNIGNEFWACSAYPKCRFIESLNVE